MTRSRKTIAAIASTVVLAAAATITVIAMSGNHAPTAPPAAHPVAATAICTKLSASAFPPAAYDELVIKEVNRITHGGSASTEDVHTAKATLAAEVKAACPQFSYLVHD